ncbi:hypothetical protein [Pseudoclavibacter sp. AY1H1]|uniref:hypothetical protein n=1 Tax=Pseudoclavibacter sp. AY1H1 TaxID=2080584 RepID=UPI000CE858AF|nr:hypothetical protein [Pseudoclavibacter sp. AY1H1]PPF36516.1 hypothetical protein C5E05_09730 [Pseudoclavibacter sp. AY1H1]
MTDQIWCIAGGEDGADRRLADALLRGGSTVAIVGRDVAPFALLVDDYADAIMPVELTATTSEALAEVRESIELNLGEVTHFGVLLGEIGEGSAEQVAGRLLHKLDGAAARNRAGRGDGEPADRWPVGAQLVLVRGVVGSSNQVSIEDRGAQNSDIEARIRLAGAQSARPMPTVRVRELDDLLHDASADAVR